MTLVSRKTRSFLAALLLAAAAPAWAGSEMPKWFGLAPELADNWVVETGERTDRVTVRRRVPAADAHKVLVLYSKRSSAYDTAISKILSVFDDKALDATVTAINYAGDADAGKAALDHARDGGYDLVYTMGSTATRFAYKEFRGAAIPVVSVCAKDPVLLGQMRDYVSGSGNNFAFTSLNVPVEVQFAYLEELRPRLRNIAVLFAHQNKSAVTTQLRPLAAVARERGITVLELGVRDRNQAKAELPSLVREAVAKMRQTDPGLGNSIFWITGSTSVFREIATINRHAETVPVLSAVPDVVRAGGDSAVLSIGVSFESNAHIAAFYGIEILANGMDAGRLKVGVVTPPDIAINFRRAREIGLKVPFNFFESASIVYDGDGRIVRDKGKRVVTADRQPAG